jgi:putative ABC transport system ATP-binding protein
MARPIVIALEGVSKVYGAGTQAVAALGDVTLAIASGEMVALVGPSGSGKSTLLNVVAGLDAATSGTVRFMGQHLSDMTDDARCDLRLRHIGIVFQTYNLFPTFTVVENVALPLEILGARPRTARDRAAATLEEMGIAAGAHRRLPAELSGGEQQRVALARALVTEPDVLLADEPTGSLDSGTGARVLDLVRYLNDGRRLTVLLATHSSQAAAYAHRTVELRDGRIVRDTGASGAR